MKKIIAIVFFLIIIFVGLYCWMRVDGKKNDVESKAYVDKVIPLIMSDWNFGEMEKNASQEMKKTLNAESCKDSFKMFAKNYGKFVKYEGSKGESVRYFTVKGTIMTARYKCKIDYEKKNFLITINLVKHSGIWRILNFKINL